MTGYMLKNKVSGEEIRAERNSMGCYTIKLTAPHSNIPIFFKDMAQPIIPKGKYECGEEFFEPIVNTLFSKGFKYKTINRDTGEAIRATPNRNETYTIEILNPFSTTPIFSEEAEEPIIPEGKQEVDDETYNKYFGDLMRISVEKTRSSLT